MILNQKEFDQLLEDISACVSKYFKPKEKEPEGVYVWPGDRVASDKGTQYVVAGQIELGDTRVIDLWCIVNDRHRCVSKKPSYLHLVPNSEPILGYDKRYLEAIGKAP